MMRRRVGVGMVLTLAAGGVLCGPVPAQERVGAAAAGERVGGTVVSARDGHPLPHALVTLVNTVTGQLAAQVVADGAGHYEFGALPPGKYRLTGAAAHYLAGSYLAHDQFATAIVTGAGLPTGALTLRLVPMASISGQILEDAEPVAHAQVSLYRENAGNTPAVARMRTVQTDEDGRYEFERLGAGRYFVGVTATPWYAVHPAVEAEGMRQPFAGTVDPALDVAYPMTFYPEARESAGASPLVLGGGEEVRADVRLHAEPALTLTLPAMTPGRPTERFPQLTQTVFGNEEGVPTSVDSVGNMPRFTGLAPAEYNVRMVGRGGLQAGSQTVDLRSGSAVLASMETGTPGSVTVTVRAADGGKLPQAVGVRDGTRATSGTSAVNDKGVATIAEVPPGDYRLVAYGPGHTWTVLSVTSAGKETQGGHLHVAQGTAVAVEATVSASVVEVDGVAMREGKPAVGAMVVLVPVGGDSSADMFRRDQSDLDGSFVFHNVVPGNYIAVAIEDGWTLRWDDAAALVPYLLHGVAVPVAAGTTGPVKLTQALVAQPR